MLTDCSSIQGSTTSSSASDVMTLTTAASSWCAIPTANRIRVLRLMRPHLRRLLVAPDTNPSYGFTVRGGKEFGTGFFVSNVERSSEADLKGLRVGDQILRINGYRVDDSIHKEFIQFVTSQDRITLKVRSVGMIPIKEKMDDRLSWHVVKTSATSVSQTPSESSACSSSYKSTTLDSRSGKDITIVLNVAPRTKLGLGICKGPEWKPGIFVQFTKEKSLARESGLRPGDQILSVNSIDFSDVLFSEAVAVMKSSNKLEMLVRTGAGCDLFPGESSGYNSSASSVTGDQSPCWGDAKSKRLTSVREESNAAIGITNWHENIYEENVQQRIDNHVAVGRKEVNKTIIKLSENGTSINNTYVSEALPVQKRRDYMKAAQSMTDLASSNCRKLPDICPKNNMHEIPRNSSISNLKSMSASNSNLTLQRKASKLSLENNGNYGTLKPASPPKPPPPTMMPLINNNRKDENSTGGNNSSLSSAIEQELRKRKAKQQQQQQQKLQHQYHVPSSTQRFSSQHAHNTNNKNNNSNNNEYNDICIRSANISINCNEREDSLNLKSPTSRRLNNHNNHNNINNNTNTSNIFKATLQNNHNNHYNNNHHNDQHNALMDEFKRAHQRMFKNGFHESEQKQQTDRQEALKRTTIMADDVNHRNSIAQVRQSGAIEIPSTATTTTKTVKITDKLTTTTTAAAATNIIPPPPPQFANSPPTNNSFKNDALRTMRPPTSPTPDYDHIEIRSTATSSNSSPSTTKTHSRNNTNYNYISNSNSNNNNSNTERRTTVRLGTVTIGEYERQRKEPGKFDFISNGTTTSTTSTSTTTATMKRNNSVEGNNINATATTLQNELHNTLQRSNLKKQNGSNEITINEHKHNCPYEQRNTVQTQQRNGSTGGGILKNGNHRTANSSMTTMMSSTKSNEKTITFGN